jgi:hypothetical protein
MLSLGSAGFMLYVIERAKKCLDFAATLYIIHLFICIIYGGWPASLTWWVVNIVGLAIMALLGEYLCIRRELQDIPVRVRASKQLCRNEFVCFHFPLNVFSYIKSSVHLLLIQESCVSLDIRLTKLWMAYYITWINLQLCNILNLMLQRSCVVRKNLKTIFMLPS